MSLVRVFVERAQVDSVRSRTNTNTGELEFQQKIWVHKSGSKFPTEFQVRLPAGRKFWEEGDYVFEIQTNIRPDKYLGLSFDPFSPTVLIPVSAQFIEAFEKNSASIYVQLNKS